MKRLRLLISTIILWLFLLYNIERLSQPLNISSVAYIFIAAIAILTILIPHINRLALGLTLGGPIALFLALKAWLGYPMAGPAIHLTITEISAIALTGLFARQINHVLEELEQLLRDIVIKTVGKPTESFAHGQGNMYREVRRARSYGRPISLMAVGIEEESLRNALPGIVVEAQQAMQKHLAFSMIAQMLDEELEDHHIIAKQNNHFIILLPEVADTDLRGMESHLLQKASDQMGLALKIGSSSLSDETVTFERLVEKATTHMAQAKVPPPDTQDTKQPTFAFLKRKGTV